MQRSGHRCLAAACWRTASGVPRADVPIAVEIGEAGVTELRSYAAMAIGLSAS